MSGQPASVNADGLFEPFHFDQVPTETFTRGVRLTGEGCRKSATMEYWEDQPA